jgi:hypothetical protein
LTHDPVETAPSIAKNLLVTAPSGQAVRHRIWSEKVAQRLLMDVLVGDAQDANPVAGKDSAPFLVILAPGSMHAAVQLHRQACRGAEEVDDEACDDLLAPKLEPEEPAVAKKLPRERLGRGRSLAKLLRDLQLARIDGRVSP